MMYAYIISFRVPFRGTEYSASLSVVSWAVQIKACVHLNIDQCSQEFLIHRFCKIPLCSLCTSETIFYLRWKGLRSSAEWRFVWIYTLMDTDFIYLAIWDVWFHWRGLFIGENLSFRSLIWVSMILKDPVSSPWRTVRQCKYVLVLHLLWLRYCNCHSCWYIATMQQLYLAGNQITSLASLPQLPNLEVFPRMAWYLLLGKMFVLPPQY